MQSLQLNLRSTPEIHAWQHTTFDSKSIGRCNCRPIRRKNSDDSDARWLTVVVAPYKCCLIARMLLSSKAKLCLCLKQCAMKTYEYMGIRGNDF